MSATVAGLGAASVATRVSELPQPPAPLTPESFAERLYLALAPLAQADRENTWSLLILCNAVGVMFQLLDEYVRDTPEGPGWSPLLDLDRCPDEALPWLAQFVGVRVLPDSAPAEQRQRITSTDGFSRGTPAAMRAAAQATLTGTQTVVITERDGDPYVLTVSTLATETPSISNTRSAVLAQKPAGLVVNFVGGAASQTYAQLKTRMATYGAMTTSYLVYNDALLHKVKP